jgi:hypothetical protein
MKSFQKHMETRNEFIYKGAGPREKECMKFADLRKPKETRQYGCGFRCTESTSRSTSGKWSQRHRWLSQSTIREKDDEHLEKESI